MCITLLEAELGFSWWWRLFYSPPTHQEARKVKFQLPVFVSTGSKKVHVTNKQLVTTNTVSFSKLLELWLCVSPSVWVPLPQVSGNCATLNNSATYSLQSELLAWSLLVNTINQHTPPSPQTSRTLGQGLHCGQWRPCSKLRPLHCCWQPPQQSGLQQRQDQSTATQR